MRRHLEKPPHLQADDYRMYVVISYLTYLGIAVHALLIPLFYWLGNEALAALNIFSTAAWFAARVRNHYGHHNSAIIILVIEVSLHTTVALYYFGWSCGFQYYLMAGIPFILFNHKMKAVPLLILSGFLCLLFITLFGLTEGRVYHYNHPAAIKAMNYANIVVSFIALMITSYYFRVASFISEQQMEVLANADQLTGLPNRRGILSLLEAQHGLTTRHGDVFSLVLADIDFFKQFNDTFGHDCGDFVLQDVANLLKHRLRQYDIVARWGGEEFLFMLPDTDAVTATLVAEDIRKVVEAHRFVFNGQPLYVTMTFGVAQNTGDNSIDDTLKLADDALYQGKESGRNRVVNGDV